jgi:hypothetical protein
VEIRSCLGPCFAAVTSVTRSARLQLIRRVPTARQPRDEWHDQRAVWLGSSRRICSQTLIAQNADDPCSATPQKPQHAPSALAGITSANLLRKQIGGCLRSSEPIHQVLLLHADSPFRQVQDLQSQIAELTQMNSQLRTKTTTKEEPIVERADTKRRLSDSHNGQQAARLKLTPTVMRDFDHVQRNIQIYSQGIFSTPHLRASAPLEEGSGLPEVPPRADFAHLSRSYLNYVHTWYPALHWPTFSQQVDEVYTARSFHGMPREWIGLFFAVLACGSLEISATPGSLLGTPNRGLSFFDVATQALTPWPQDLTIVHAQVALLLSIFATESNLKAIGSMWLSNAVRAAQELYINTEIESWPIVDGEIRRRLWWSIYSRDRYVWILHIGKHSS